MNERVNSRTALRMLQVLAPAALIALGAPALAQDAATPPSTPPAAKTEKSPPAKSLDELLGTGGAKATPTAPAKPTLPPGGAEGGSSTDAAAQKRGDDLNRALTESEAGEAFAQAIAQMSRSATLLDEALDPGIDTQRVQEDVLAKLDLLLKQPPKRSKSKSSSSSSSSSAQRQPQNAPPRQQPGQRQGQRSEQPASDSNENLQGPPRQEGALDQALESDGSEWGNLPARIRDMIRQGLRDRPSSLYQRLTEEYYRRLAEEAGR